MWLSARAHRRAGAITVVAVICAASYTMVGSDGQNAKDAPRAQNRPAPGSVSVTLEFPRDRAMGAILGRPVAEPGAEPAKFKPIGKAQGSVTIPAGTEIFMRVADGDVVETLSDPDTCHYGINDVRGKVDFSALDQLKAAMVNTLVLSNLDLSDDEIKHIQDLKTLQYLDISGNHAITGDGLRYISGMTNLEGLDLSFTNLFDSGLEHLKGLTRLRKVHFGGTKLTGEGIKILAQLPSLEALALNAMPLGDDALAALASAPGLKDLVVANTQATDVGFNEIGKLPNLQKLFILSETITTAGIGSIRDHSKLEDVFIHGPLDDRAAAVFCEMPALHRLIIASDKFTDAGLSDLEKIGDRIDDFGLFSESLTDEGLTPSMKAFPNLINASIGSKSVTDESLAVFTQMKNLKFLDLSNCAVSREGLNSLKKQLPKGCRISYPMADYPSHPWKPTADEKGKYPARAIQFPGHRIGVFYTFRPDEAGNILAEEGIDESRGEIRIPAGRAAGLRCTGSPETLQFVLNLPPGFLQGVNFYRVPEAGWATKIARLNLIQLGLDEGDIRPDQLKELAKIETLECLKLRTTTLKDEDIKILMNMPRLKWLDLGGAPVTDELAEILKEFPRLESLDLSHTEIGDGAIEGLVAMKNLKRLEIRGTRVSEAGFKRLLAEMDGCKVSF